MTVLIVGGTGFIGQRLVKALIKKGETVVCMDVRPRRSSFDNQNLPAKVIAGDITRFDDLAAVLAQETPTAIVNLAYLLGEGEATPHLATRVNILGMDNILEAARLQGVRRVVYASSIAYHGASQEPYANRALNEEEPPVRGGVYTSCKQFNEAMAAVYNQLYELEAVAIRPSFVIGEAKPRGIFQHLECITKPAIGEAVHSRSRASARYLLAHVEDIAEIFSWAATAPTLQHRVYHTGGHDTSLGDLATLVRNLIPDASIEFQENGWNGMLVHRVDNSRLLAESGLTHRSLEQAVHDIVTTMREIYLPS